MQDRPEHFLGQILGAGQLEHVRGHVAALRGGAAGEMHRFRLPLHRRDMRLQPLFRLRVDDRADMNGEIARITQPQFAGGACDHGDHAIGHILLHEEQAQGRAALAGGAEGAHDHVICDLLGESGGIDDHGIDAPGFGNERCDRPLLLSQGQIDRPAPPPWSR